MKHGDSVIAVNSMPVRFYDEFDSIKRTLAGQQIVLTVMRDGQEKTLTGIVPENKILGFAPSRDRFFQFETIKYNPAQAVGKGSSFAFEKVGNYASSLKMLFTSKEVKASESLGGFITIGKIFPDEFNMEKFLMLTAFLSIILAFMNLLPIPGLDGGYVLFLLFEMISGRKVSEKVMEKATTVGLVLILTLMVYGNGMDIFRLFKK